MVHLNTLKDHVTKHLSKKETVVNHTDLKLFVQEGEDNLESSHLEFLCGESLCLGVG